KMSKIEIATLREAYKQRGAREPLGGVTLRGRGEPLRSRPDRVKTNPDVAPLATKLTAPISRTQGRTARFAAVPARCRFRHSLFRRLGRAEVQPAEKPEAPARMKTR